MSNLYLTQLRLTQLLFLFVFGFQLNAQPNYPRNVQEAELINTDINNFLSAYDRLEEGVDTIGILNEYYFSKASAGLTEYIGRHQLTPKLLKKAIENNPDVYKKIAHFNQQLSNIDSLLKEALQRYHRIVPSTMFAPTYLIVGANRGIAQASMYGQLVTVTRMLENPSKLIMVIIHELTHFQQAMAIGLENYVGLYSTKDNMLGLCLREGGAEFTTYLAMNEITQKRSLAYFDEHANELNQRFQQDLQNQDPSYWLWDSIGKDKNQQLMGYVMGFKICQSYYKNSNNKAEAIKEILGVTDFMEFLENSGYY